MKVSLQDCLDDIIDNRGVTPHKKNTEWQDSGIKVLSANNIKTSGLQKLNEIRYIDESIYDSWMKIPLEKGDIILTSEAPAGEVYYWDSDEKIILGQRLYGLKVKKTINSKYLKYYLQSKTGQDAIKKQQSGSTVFGISAATFPNIIVNLPDKKHQDKAADIMWALDSKIKENTKISADLESLAKTIYDYWFLQFEFPDANGKPYKSSGGRMVWNEALKREVPEGWKYKKLDNHISFSRGIAYTSNDIKDKSGLPMFNLASVDISRNYQPNGLKYYSGKYKKDDIIYPGDFVIACTDLTRNRDIIGSPVCVPNTHDKFVSSMDLAKLNITSNELIGYYVYSALRQESYHNYIKWFASGTNVQHLDLDGILNYPILFPDINIQKKYSDIIHNLEKKKGIILKENQDLAALRDFLLPMLMNGQVTFKDEKECPA